MPDSEHSTKKWGRTPVNPQVYQMIKDHEQLKGKRTVDHLDKILL